MLVTGIESSVGGDVIESLTYSYDALNRPVTRNADTFGYNDRSEVVFSRRGAYPPAEGCPRSGCPSRGENAEDSYAYDNIGNLTASETSNGDCEYTANNLNQYTSILCNSTFPREASYGLDGNLLTDGIHTFTYDAANRLKIVSTNGVQILTNFYDAKSRRVRKVTPTATHAFFYDDWNLIEERVAYTNGITLTIHYCWGKDLSGTLQGAGGVGGLLYFIVDGAIYVPFYDNNGNITRDLDAETAFATKAADVTIQFVCAGWRKILLLL